MSIQIPTISLEMPVRSQGHCGFPVVDLGVLPFPWEDGSVFGNFVITFIYVTYAFPLPILDNDQLSKFENLP